MTLDRIEYPGRLLCHHVYVVDLDLGLFFAPEKIESGLQLIFDAGINQYCYGRMFPEQFFNRIYLRGSGYYNVDLDSPCDEFFEYLTKDHNQWRPFQQRFKYVVVC